MSKKAFTLAEVLITLAIVGTVAALTVPTLMAEIQKPQGVASLKKAYNDLSQAMQLIKNDNNGIIDFSIAANDNDHNYLMNVFAQKMNFSRTCNKGTVAGNCWNNMASVKNLNGGTFAADPSWYAGANLNSGVYFMFFMVSKTCNNNKFILKGQNIECGEILVDINGPKSPNQAGRDIFLLRVTKNGIFAADTIMNEAITDPENIYNVGCNKSYSDGWSGYRCAGKIITEGGINY